MNFNVFFTVDFILKCQVILGTVISHFTKMSTQNKVSVVGTVKRGLPSPVVPPFNHISSLIVPAIIIAAVSLCINISLGKTFGKKHGYKVSSNQVRQLKFIELAVTTIWIMPTLAIHLSRNCQHMVHRMSFLHFFNVFQIQLLSAVPFCKRVAVVKLNQRAVYHVFSF